MEDVEDLKNVTASDIQKTILALYIAETFILEEPQICSLHTINKHWKEMEVTWNDAMKDTPWEMYPATQNDDTFALKNGGDIEIDPVDSPISKNVNEWQEFDVTSAIKDFMDNPEDNHGFMIRNSSEQQPHIYFSSEYEEIGKRPKLTFKISTPITNLTNNKSKVSITIKSINEGVEVVVPFNNSYDIKILSLNGKNIARLTNNIKQKVIIKNDLLSTGINIITIKHNDIKHNYKLFRNK